MQSSLYMNRLMSALLYGCENWSVT